MPPPSSGGVALIEVLQALERFPLESMGLNSSAYLHTLAEALKHAYADRAQTMGDPDFVDIPAAYLTSQGRASAIARAIHPLRTRPVRGYVRQLPEDRGTNHLVVVDQEGNVVAATSTINGPFGSLVAVPGRGFVLNDQMGVFAPQPGVRDEQGRVASEAVTVAPGKRPPSSMTPTIVLRDGVPVLALGGAGGPRIITGTLQTLLNVVVFGRDVQQALDAPRIHHQWVPEELLCEDALAPDVLRALGLKGHALDIQRSLGNRVQAVEIGEGWLEAASDPREAGRPAGY
jgi:gamma-glutamyltranspeptidase/glutathione hydrolase